MKMSINSGASVAALAAALLFAGSIAVPHPAAASSKGHCIGANACKGKSACKTASNACKGQNACKGKGFTKLSAAKCAKIQGATFEPIKKG